MQVIINALISPCVLKISGALFLDRASFRTSAEQTHFRTLKQDLRREHTFRRWQLQSPRVKYIGYVLFLNYAELLVVVLRIC